MAQYEKPLTKGHCPIKSKNDPDKRDPEKLAKKRSERRERSHQLKEKIIKLIESGLQLSEYQARKVLKLKPSHVFFAHGTAVGNLFDFTGFLTIFAFE